MNQNQPQSPEEKLRYATRLLVAYNKRAGLGPEANRFVVHKQLEDDFSGDTDGIFAMIFETEEIDPFNPVERQVVARIIDKEILRSVNDPECK